MAKRRIPKTTPEEEAEFDERTRRIHAHLEELHERIEAEKRALEQTRARRRRLFPFFRAGR